uniref:Uncharacterized protein n=1 Tax=Rhizophora mucronata TaxID=61149 RepID=A0A2P2MBW9_RHIMU
MFSSSRYGRVYQFECMKFHALSWLMGSFHRKYMITLLVKHGIEIDITKFYPLLRSPLSDCRSLRL